jgi:hypothetical protein
LHKPLTNNYSLNYHTINIESDGLPSPISAGASFFRQNAIKPPPQVPPSTLHRGKITTPPKKKNCLMGVGSPSPRISRRTEFGRLLLLNYSIMNFSFVPEISRGCRKYLTCGGGRALAVLFAIFLFINSQRANFGMGQGSISRSASINVRNCFGRVQGWNRTG